MSYNPTLGRWAQRDGEGYVDGASLYESRRSNPEIFVDSQGLASVHIGVVQDGTTSIADWWNGGYADANATIDLRDGKTPDWDAVMRQLEHDLDGTPITSITISGHNGGANIADIFTPEALADPNSGPSRLMRYLRNRLTDENDGLTLKVCNQATGDKGKKWLQLLADTLGTNVVGWDDWYAIVPHGKEWTATPEGSVTETGDTGRVWYGSWLQWLRDRLPHVIKGEGPKMSEKTTKPTPKGPAKPKP